MNIKSLTVENFKSFEKLTLKDLLPINMVFGYNNSGKSNLFKFLELVFSSMEYKEKVTEIESSTKRQDYWNKTIVNQPFIFKKNTDKPKYITFKITLEVTVAELRPIISGYEIFEQLLLPNNGDAKPLVTLEGTISPAGSFNAVQVLDKLSVNDKVIYDDGNLVRNQQGDGPIIEHNQFTSLLNLFGDCVVLLDNDRYFIDEVETELVLETSSKSFKNDMFQMHMSHLKVDELKELAKFLRTFHVNSDDTVFANNEKSSPFSKFDFEFSRFNDGKLEIMLVNDFGRFPISNFGTGVQQIIYILSRIFLAPRNRIFLVEEIELNLSPKYQIELVQFVSEHLIGKYIDQFFYTTHSPLMCYRTQNRTLQARIDAAGNSTIQEFTADEEEVKQLKAAMKLLEHYHPNAKKKVAGAGNGNGQAVEEATPPQA